MVRACRLDHLSVCLSVLSVRKVYCGKTADWIRIPFWVVSGVGRGMGVLDGVVIVEGRGSLGDEFGASHCNRRGRRRAVPKLLL